MKITTDTAQLKPALRLIAGRAPTHPDRAIHAGIHLSAEGEHVILSAYDPVTTGDDDVPASTRLTLPAVVHQSGSAVASGRTLQDIAHILLRQGTVEITAAFERLHIAFETTHISVPTLPVEEYPTLPKPTATCGHLSGADLARALEEVAPAVGNDDTLPVLTGIRLELSGSTLTVSATDRYRIASRDIPISRTDRTRPKAVVVPARQLLATARALRTTQDVSVGIGPSGPLTLAGDAKVFTHKPFTNSQKVPAPATLMPDASAFRTTVRLEKQPLLDAVRRIHFVAERNTPLELRVEAEYLHIRTGDAENIQLTDHIDPCTVTGPAMTVTFNTEFLLKGLTKFPGDTVDLNLVSPHSPALLSDDTSRQYLLMPVRLVTPTHAASTAG